MPVLKIIGFLNLQTYLISSKLFHSPDPILNAGTQNFTNLSTAAFENGVLMKIFFFDLIYFFSLSSSFSDSAHFYYFINR